MRKPWETVKIKILLGYLFLVGIAAFTVWLIYSEILLFSGNKTRISSLNSKILYFNSVLTNLYQAEALERTYSQTGNPAHYQNYEHLMDVIYMQFDSLSKISENQKERFHSDSILKLLDKKRENLKEFAAIKRVGSPDDLYERALDNFSINRDSLNSLFSVHKTITDKRESTYVELKKKKFFERLRYAFNPRENKDSLLKVNKQQIVQTDSLVNEFSPADSVIQYLTSLMQDIREENETSEMQLAGKEREVLANDRTITLQLRQMLAMYEQEIIVSSLNELRNLQDRIRLTTGYLIALGILALLVIVVFLVLILKDITRSQQYRKELEQAKAFSDSLLKSKEQFMLSIAHDIKSPIASVTGYAKLLQETDKWEEKDRYLENINKSAFHILKLISDLVDFTKLETGKLSIEKSGFNLFSLISDIFSGFYPMAASKNLEFRMNYNLPRDLIYYSDPVRLKQILENIISNAVKYTDAGSIDIWVSISSSDGLIDNLQLTVADTGIGISQEDSKLIFNEFTQVQLKDRERYEGVGLGLSIAQRLVNLLSGTISLKSEPGVGSNFTVMIPLERGVQVQNIESEIPLVEPLEGIKILLIDDDEIFLNLISETLHKAKIEAIKCTSTIQAIKVLGENPVDLILTDIHMPAMNGTDLLAYIQRKTGKLTPVIAVSGMDEPGIDDFPGIKLAAFLKKPFRREELLDLIQIVVRRNRTNQKDPLYTLEQIRQFALDDPQSIQNILVSFVESSTENLKQFEKLLMEQDRKSIAELSHKMLAMFRQLEAEQIVNPLVALEKNRDFSLSNEEWMGLATDTKNRIKKFLEVFCEEQGIIMQHSHN